VKALTLSFSLAATVAGSLGFTSLRDGWEGNAPGEERTIAGFKFCQLMPLRAPLFQDALLALRRGDFSRLEPLLDGGRTIPDR
jgi:hypothetical protein